MARVKIYTDDYLLDLAERVDNEKFEGNFDIGFYFNAYGHVHPFSEEVRCVLIDSRDLDNEQPWDSARAAALLDCNPALFSENDKDLAIRAIWKSGRTGFYHDARELYPNGWVSTLLRNLNKLKDNDAKLPKYPEPSHFNPNKVSEYWKGFDGLLPIKDH